MNRRGFIKIIAGLFAGSSLSANTYHTLELTSCYIAGLQYHAGKQMAFQTGEALKLIREPNNLYDTNAIALYKQHIKIGYIPKNENKIIAKMLDQHAALKAEISHFDRNAVTWRRVSVQVKQVLG